MNAPARIAVGHSVCPHDCPSTCALDVELLGGNRIGRVHGSADHSYTAGVVCAKVAGPFLVVVLAIGIVIGLLQSVTQLQEPTLTFVPKLIGAAAVIAVSGNWMLASLVSYGHDLIAGVPQLLKG